MPSPRRELGDRIAEASVGNEIGAPVSSPAHSREQPYAHLSTGLIDLKLCRMPTDGLAIAELEVEEWHLVDCSPVAAV
jgi:hypothetical protein